MTARCRWTILVICAFVAACSHDERLGGPWVMVTRDRLPEAGFGESRLYHVVGWRRTLVDRFIGGYRVYDGGKCIAYDTLRDGGSYAACQGKQPLELSEDDVRGLGPEGWKFRSCGFVTVEPARNVKDQTKRFIIRTETFTRAARQQPVLRPEWWKRVGTIQKVEPEMIDAAAVCAD